MIRKQEATGKTVDEARAKACALLGVQADDLNVSCEVLEMPQKTGFLGLKLTPAKVCVSVEEPDAPAAAPAEPVVEKKTPVQEAVKAAAAQTTAGVAKVSQTRYTTYVLGDGAIEYTDCGAKVPYEMDRDPHTNGGEDTLYGRQRKCFAPYGINFTKAKMKSLSPTDDELEDGENWELVNSNEAEGKQYIARKAIPIARILSLA